MKLLLACHASIYGVLFAMICMFCFVKSKMQIVRDFMTEMQIVRDFMLGQERSLKLL